MARRASVTVLGVLALSSCVVSQNACGTQRRVATPPTILSDLEFWSLSTALSEPAGAFAHSDNLVSNEIQFVQLIRVLHPTGGVYIGVGPEQNFSYIARLHPAMAFIIDIRRENRNLHFMYKALFELSENRVDFVSRLFSREPPAGVGPNTPVQELFMKFGSARRDRGLYEANSRLIRERLVSTRGFPLSPEDLKWIEYAFTAFYSDGPEIDYAGARPSDPPSPSYRALMSATDVNGQRRSYLATEEGFAFVKDLHARNLIVPVVGDFGGPSAIRRTGDYVRQHGETVRAFYGSNVEVYLNRQQIAAFCGNLAALPYDSRTWFIGSKDLQPLPSKLKTCPPGSR